MSNYLKSFFLLAIVIVVLSPIQSFALEFEKNSEGAIEFTSSTMESSVHRIKLVPTSTLSREEFQNIFVLGCVTNTVLKGDIVVGAWTFSNLTGDVCTTGTQANDVKWCTAEYRSAPAGYCAATATAKWQRLERIGYSLEGDRPQLKNNKPFSCTPDTFCNDGSMELSPSDTLEWQQRNNLHDTLNWFYAVGYFVPINASDITDDQSSLKIKDQIFKKSNEVKPVKYRFDPYGYVFDAQSLEPLINVPVYLFEKWQPVTTITPLPSPAFYNKLSETNIGVASIQNTLSTGSFSFVVADGTYALDVLPVAPSQTAAYLTRDNSALVDVSEQGLVRGARINGGVYKVYVTVDEKQKELYTELYPKTYSPIEGIVQTGGKIQRRDLPVTASKVGASPTRGLAIINDTNIRNNDSGLYVFGTVSHPYTLVEAVIDGLVQPYKTRATIDGTWGITISSDAIKPQSVVTVKLTKPAFYSSVLGVNTEKNEVVAQGDGLEISIPVMPQYIDAIAKDITGKAIPSTEVRVIDEMSGQVSYSTMTDASGRYLIPPHGLPTYRYRLEYGTGSSKRTVKTTDILSENREHFTSNSIDLFSALEGRKAEILTYSQSTPSATLSGAPVSPSVLPSGTAVNPSGMPSTPSVAPTQPVGQLAQLFVYIALLILLIAVTVLLILYYVKRHREPHMYDAGQPPPSSESPVPPSV